MATLDLLAGPARTIGLGLTAFGLATSAGFIAAPLTDAIYDQSTGAWIREVSPSMASLVYVHVAVPPESGVAAPEASVLTSAESVRELRAESGLTWEQLARLFGVSRRAVHHWATGGRMNSVNEEHLNIVWDAVRKLPASQPSERRSLLLFTAQSGSSVFELLKSGSPTSEVLQASAYSHDQLLGLVES